MLKSIEYGMYEEIVTEDGSRYMKLDGKFYIWSAYGWIETGWTEEEFDKHFGYETYKKVEKMKREITTFIG